MASSCKESAHKANLLGKREAEDDLKTKPVPKKHKEKSEEKDSTERFSDNFISAKEVAVRKKTVFVTHLPRLIEISDIINFFTNVGEVVRVRRIVNRKGQNGSVAFVEFASANEAKKALEEKNGQYLHGYKIFVDVIKIATYPPKYCIDHKVVWYEDYLRQESLLIEEDKTVEGLIEEVPAREKTLFVANLSPQTKISDINYFFNYVGEVVSVRLIVNNEGKHVGCGFVEFASTNEAKKVLEEKNGEYLHDHKIFLDVAKIAPSPPRPKYNLVEKLWYEDYLLRKSLTVEGFDEHSDFVEKFAVREKTLFVGHLSRQTEISDIINFFNYVGEVVRVRLILNHKGEHEGFGFVEFASANEAKKALEEKNGENLCGHEISLGVAEIAQYPPQPKYCIDHKVWYKDYLRREGLLLEEDETVEGLFEEVAARKKTCFVANLPPQIERSDIIKFFKNVGTVVSVRLIVNNEGKHVGCGFVELASANEAIMALEKNGAMMKNGHLIFVDVAEIAPYPLRPKYNLAEKLWYEDYLQRESLLIEEDDLETKPIPCSTKTIFIDDESEEDEALTQNNTYILY